MANDQFSFNEQAYLAANPDVAAQIGRPGVSSGYQHYQNWGQKEGRQGIFDQQMAGWNTTPSVNQSNFDAQSYLSANPDVAASGLDPWTHYLYYGKEEGRQGALNNNVIQNANTFNTDAYLAANQDVAKSGLDPYQHYLQYGKNEGRQASFDKPNYSAFELRSYGDENSGGSYYVDPATGNAYNIGTNEEGALDYKNAQRIASGAALNDQLLQDAGFTYDPAKAQAEYALKQSNPHQFYNDVSNKIGENYFTAWSQNRGSENDFLRSLEDVKKDDPAAYYKTLIDVNARKVGWQYGQNRQDRADVHAKDLNALIPDAIKAGIAPQELNNLINTGVSEASRQNQIRIANEAQNSKGYLAGLPQFAGTVGALFAAPALAGYLTPALGGSALAGGAATGAILGGASGAINASANGGNIGQGLLKGGILGGATGAIGGGIADAFSGASSTALPYTEAFDAANMAKNGYDAATIAQNLTATGMDSFIAQDMANLASQGLSSSQIESILQASYTPEELAGIGMESANTGSKIAEKATSKTAQNLAKSQLAKLLSGSSSGAKSNGVDLSKLASMLGGSSFTPLQLAQIKSQNPFFWSTEGTLGGEDIYDVSGSNLAKALRKA